MAALDFPASPTVGQIYTANGRSWKWDGVSWISANQITSIGVTGSTLTIYGSPIAHPDATSMTFANSVTLTAASTKTLTLNGGAGSNGLVIDASNNVGVGTSSPQSRLNVYSSSAGGAVLTLSDGTLGVTFGGQFKGYGTGGVGGFAEFGSFDAGTYSRGFLVAQQANYLSFCTGSGLTSSNTEKMRLDSSGNLGLGVTPSAWNDGIASARAFQVGSVSPYYIYSDGAGTGYTGTNAYYSLAGSPSWKYVSSASATQYQQYQGAHVWFNATSGTAGNPITFNQAMTLEAGGALRLNNTATPTGNTGFGGEISVIGNSTNGALFYTTAGSANSGVPIESSRLNDGAGIYFFRNGSAAGYVQVTTGAVSLANSSDYRLKENPVSLSGSLHKILQVRPVTFAWKENGSEGKSVIAHELQEIFPEAVFGEKDAVNEDGSIKPQSVSLGLLIPDMIVAIKELSAELNELKQKVNA